MFKMLIASLDSALLLKKLICLFQVLACLDHICIDDLPGLHLTHIWPYVSQQFPDSWLTVKLPSYFGKC